MAIFSYFNSRIRESGTVSIWNKVFSVSKLPDWSVGSAKKQFYFLETYNMVVNSFKTNQKYQDGSSFFSYQKYFTIYGHYIL